MSHHNHRIAAVVVAVAQRVATVNHIDSRRATTAATSHALSGNATTRGMNLEAEYPWYESPCRHDWY